MNRTITEAAVKRLHDDDQDQLRNHHVNFISACAFGRRLKPLKGRTPYEFIHKQWTIEPERLTLNPMHQMPGLNMSLPVRYRVMRDALLTRRSLDYHIRIAAFLCAGDLVAARAETETHMLTNKGAAVMRYDQSQSDAAPQ